MFSSSPQIARDMSGTSLPMCVAALVCAVYCLFIAGCKSTDLGIAQIKGIYGPAGRNAIHAAQEHRLDDDALAPLEGQSEFDHAKQLYDEKKYREAEKAFGQLAKQYKDKPIEEDAMFMRAECQFQRKRYPLAQDSYNALMKKYESSRYLDKITRRLFTIVETWLDFPKPVENSDIQLVSDEDAETPSSQPDVEKRPMPLIPNFTDRSRPVFDTDGRALQALKSIWLNDPTGSLADDAIMMSAVYHLRTGDFLEADRHFKMLRDHYPNSTHAMDAHVLGAKVVQLTYQGPKYDGRKLSEAKQLTESTLSRFPESKDRQRLQEALAKMEAQLAQRDWERIEYRMRRKEYDSVEILCQVLIEERPQSAYAKLARERLEKIRAKRSQAKQASPELQEEIFETATSERDSLDVDEPSKLSYDPLLP